VLEVCPGEGAQLAHAHTGRDCRQEKGALEAWLGGSEERSDLFGVEHPHLFVDHSLVSWSFQAGSGIARQVTPLDCMAQHLA
jgi:hypothetical protein